MVGAVKRHRFEKEIVAKVRRLYPLDNYHGVLALLGDYLTVVTCVIAVELFGWVIYPLAIIVIGSRQRALATITHEAAHVTLARNTTLNNFLGTYCSGYLIGMLMDAYRRSHVGSHHGNFGSQEEDSDYQFMISLGVYSTAGRLDYIWNLFVAPLLLLRLPSYLTYLVRERLMSWKNKAGRAEFTRFALFWALILSGLFLSGNLIDLLLYWIIPFLTSYQIIGWYIELSEHAPLMHSNLDVRMSRNRNSHWLERLLTGIHGESYHLAHHLWPRVPFWRMKELNAILREDPVYRDQDDSCGGIILSANGAPTVVSIFRSIARASNAESLASGKVA